MIIAEQVGMPAKIVVIIKSSVFRDIVPTILATCFTLVFLLGLFFESRDGSDVLL
jgi:hypothetical protein